MCLDNYNCMYADYVWIGREIIVIVYFIGISRSRLIDGRIAVSFRYVQSSLSTGFQLRLGDVLSPCFCREISRYGGWPACLFRVLG